MPLFQLILVGSDDFYVANFIGAGITKSSHDILMLASTSFLEVA